MEAPAGAPPMANHPFGSRSLARPLRLCGPQAGWPWAQSSWPVGDPAQEMSPRPPEPLVSVLGTTSHHAPARAPVEAAGLGCGRRAGRCCRGPGRRQTARRCRGRTHSGPHTPRPQGKQRRFQRSHCLPPLTGVCVCAWGAHTPPGLRPTSRPAQMGATSVPRSRSLRPCHLAALRAPRCPVGVPAAPLRPGTCPPGDKRGSSARTLITSWASCKELGPTVTPKIPSEDQMSPGWCGSTN